MRRIVSTVTNKPRSRSRKDDDFVNRLSNRYTVIMLVVFCIVVISQTYVGNPITCWTPAHFTKSHQKYTNNYCWVRNTYYVPLDIRHSGPAESGHIQYYQWIPFILLIQALFFWAPSLIWHGLNQRVGVDADNILVAAHTYTIGEKINRRRDILHLIVNQFHRFLKNGGPEEVPCSSKIKQLLSKICLFCGHRFGSYLVLLFIFTKFLYLANAIGQLFILSHVLRTDYSFYGVDIIRYILHGQDWTNAPDAPFPRVTLCDFNVRRLKNIHSYTVQCTLPINMYNEKIYMIFWFWVIFVATITLLDLIVWILRYISKKDKIKFLVNHLEQNNSIDSCDRSDMQQVHEFYNYYLRQDGVFLLRLIGHNTDNITVSEISKALWDCYNDWQIELNATASGKTKL